MEKNKNKVLRSHPKLLKRPKRRENKVTGQHKIERQRKNNTISTALNSEQTGLLIPPSL